MKVKILTSIAGHAEPLYELPDFSFAPGEETELHDDLAAAWIASGIAAPVAVKPEPAKKSR